MYKVPSSLDIKCQDISSPFSLLSVLRATFIYIHSFEFFPFLFYIVVFVLYIPNVVLHPYQIPDVEDEQIVNT